MTTRSVDSHVVRDRSRVGNRDVGSRPRRPFPRQHRPLPKHVPVGGVVHSNIFDVITSATSVSVFVSWKDREEALALVQDVFQARPRPRSDGRAPPET